MSNHLASQNSLYLHQHADNPVDWWPWGEQALDAARAANKPILLSIGYSACHWCHVMAHESFEDPATAALMNELFVNIKVDREERPDLDRVYQHAQQALTGHGGGWPLTMFLQPETLLPFFAGTYFPPSARHGLPAFREVLRGVRAWYDEHPDQRQQQDAQLVALLHEQSAPASGELDAQTGIRTAFARWQSQFDDVFGGHRGAPKFPHVGELDLMLDVLDDPVFPHVAADAETMLRRTLHGMADGGLQDQLGGGFFRYSVDARWEIPHFEKMLYDNAQLLGAYARAAQHLDEPAFASVAQTTAQWLQRDMRLTDGGYAAALDADSEGVEGRYYLWQPEPVRALLDPEAFAVAARHYGLDQPANFEGQDWHLTARVDTDKIATALKITAAEANNTLQDARVVLLQTRAQRIPPARDDKLLGSWNALTIGALARSARLLGDTGLLQQADDSLQALRHTLWHDGQLRGASTITTRGFLDDHALLLDALLELLAARWRRADLDWAITLADTLLSDFADDEVGGFHFTAHDHETLPQRPKSFSDDSLPNGNGVAARALLRLGHLLGDNRYLDAAEGTLRAGAGTLERYPETCSSLLRALYLWQQPPAHVVVHCTSAHEPAWREALTATVRHEHADAWVITDTKHTLPGLLGARHMHGDGSAWLCRGLSCQPRIDTPAALRDALSAGRPSLRAS